VHFFTKRTYKIHICKKSVLDIFRCQTKKKAKTTKESVDYFFI